MIKQMLRVWLIRLLTPGPPRHAGCPTCMGPCRQVTEEEVLERAAQAREQNPGRWT